MDQNGLPPSPTPRRRRGQLDGRGQRPLEGRGVGDGHRGRHRAGRRPDHIDLGVPQRERALELLATAPAACCPVPEDARGGRDPQTDTPHVDGEAQA